MYIINVNCVPKINFVPIGKDLDHLGIMVVLPQAQEVVLVVCHLVQGAVLVVCLLVQAEALCQAIYRDRAWALQGCLQKIPKSVLYLRFFLTLIIYSYSLRDFLTFLCIFVKSYRL